MYSEITALLFDGSGTGVLDEFISAVGDMFQSVLPVAIPIVGGIAVGFFAIRVVRGLLHA